VLHLTFGELLLGLNTKEDGAELRCPGFVASGVAEMLLPALERREKPEKEWLTINLIMAPKAFGISWWR
jgi:hypothetical protein